MTENRSLEGTIRDSRPDELPDGAETPRINLSVLTVSHERFRIIKTYAQGGLGVVSIAYDVELDRVVAVKEMRIGRPSDDDVQRFLLEARLTGQLDHPGIPPVYALGYFEDGRPFYAMRLVDGVTLRSAVKEFHAKYPAPDLSRSRSMQLRQLIGAVVSVCNTLRFAHSKGVLHRDIKPSNIMLGEYGETLLMDWGLAKSQKQSLPYSDLEAKAHQQRKRLEDPEDTGTGSVMGTPHYMSPEQAVGDVDSINQRSEVYSLGATLYSVLTGKPPFSGQTREEILAKVCRGDFLPPRAVDARVPPELNAICLKAMALERGDRYADTGELATDIEHWLADESISCYREPRSRRWQRWIRLHQAWVAGLTALMVTLFIGLVIGTSLVSFEHIEAVAARKDAEVATEKAETITRQSRDMLSRTFVTTFNSRLRNIPGTERTRLEVLELFINQFQQWSDATPDSFRNRHELAQAIYERSLIHNEMNELELAWADMNTALRILGDLMQSPDRAMGHSSLLDRMHLSTEMAKLQSELEGGSRNAEALVQQAYYWTSREADVHGQTAVYQFYFAKVSLELGCFKHLRRQNHQAFELVSQASAILTKLQSPEFSQELSLQMFEGVQATRFLLYRCKHELARIAWDLRDRELAIQLAERVESQLRDLQLEFSENIDAGLLRWANQIALVNFGAIETNEAFARLKEITQTVRKVLVNRPRHRGLLRLQRDALLELANLELLEARLELAQADIESAWQVNQTLASIARHAAMQSTESSRISALRLTVSQLTGEVDDAFVCWASSGNDFDGQDTMHP